MFADRLTSAELREKLDTIPEGNLAIVSLSQWTQLTNLVIQNAQVTDIVLEYPFREIIIITDECDDLRLEKYINRSEEIKNWKY